MYGQINGPIEPPRFKPDRNKTYVQKAKIIATGIVGTMVGVDMGGGRCCIRFKDKAGTGHDEMFAVEELVEV